MADEPEAAKDDAKAKEVKLPAGWGGGGASKQGGPKRWRADARGDDPSVRVVHAPLKDGIGTGKAFFFLFGFKRASQRDQQMLKRELEQIDDDVETLRNAGYTVVIDPQGCYREHGSHMDLEVPLPEGRSHFVEAFLIDASDPFCEGEILFGVEANVAK